MASQIIAAGLWSTDGEQELNKVGGHRPAAVCSRAANRSCRRALKGKVG
jgi:hypothetical protein